LLNANKNLAYKYKTWTSAEISPLYFLHDDKELTLRSSLNALYSACSQSDALKYLAKTEDKSKEFSVMVFCSHMYNTPQVQNTIRYLMHTDFFNFINCQLAILTEVPVSQLIIMVQTVSNPLEVFLRHTDFSVVFKGIKDPSLNALCNTYLHKRASKWYY